MTFIISVLAVWRLAHLITSESGPFRVIIRVRTWAGHGELAKLMDCIKCCSIWLGFLIGFYNYVSPMHYIILSLALSGGAIIIDEGVSWLAAVVEMNGKP